MTTPSSEPIPSPAPFYVRFPRWLFSWRTIGRGLVALAALATLVALLYAEEDWRGNRAWRAYKSELEAKGEKLEWKDYIPAPVADDQNFAMTPFLAPLFDFNPPPRHPGQPLWRDTNGYNRALKFGDEIRASLERVEKWNKQRTNELATVTAPSKSGETNRPSTGMAAPSRREEAAEVLRDLEKVQPQVDELRAASRRPFARFNLPYTNDFLPTILLSHLSVVKTAAVLFHARARAELELGQVDPAFADAEMVLYLAETIKDEPFLLDELVRLAAFNLAVQPIAEGLARRQWSEPQLAELEARLSKMAFLTPGALRGERAFGLGTIEQLQRGRNWDALQGGGWENPVNPFALVPGGWLALSQLDVARLYQEVVLPGFDVANQRVYPSRVNATDAEVMKRLGVGFSPYRMLARMMFPAISKTAMKIAVAQNSLNQTRIACALERFRLANGRFPETLPELSPRFLASIPHDIIGGEPLKYHRLPDGRFTLYSIGWNEKDDGGQVALTSGKSPSVDVTRGDWVWQYPAKWWMP